MIELPLFKDPLYSMRVRLSGRDYIVRVDWNGREERFYLSLYDNDDAPVLLGLKLVENWPLLVRHHANAKVPPGELMVIDANGDGPPLLDDAGDRCRLVYLEPGEVAA